MSIATFALLIRRLRQRAALNRYLIEPPDPLTEAIETKGKMYSRKKYLKQSIESDKSKTPK